MYLNLFENIFFVKDCVRSLNEYPSMLNVCITHHLPMVHTSLDNDSQSLSGIAYVCMYFLSYQLVLGNNFVTFAIKECWSDISFKKWISLAMWLQDCLQLGSSPKEWQIFNIHYSFHWKRKIHQECVIIC